MPGEDKKRSVAMVTYQGAALLDLVAAQTVLDRGTGYRTVSVGERAEPLGSDTPVSIVPEKGFEEVPAPFALVVPGCGDG